MILNQGSARLVMRRALVPEDLRRLTAAERRVVDREAYKQRQAQEQQARVSQVIDEFGGMADPATTMAQMADELLYCREVMQDILAFMDKIRTEEPFGLFGAGPYWEGPPKVRRWWFR